ncbi:MAG: M48 family metallopeptidase, partial [Planctomycetes bacterium]|nr:M48 family metallopeptidase [Planctomycetota bacterium]
EIDANSPEFRQYWNVVEEMKIASGLPMPRVYVMHDHSPNAFATGRGPQDGRVCVTTGLLETLDRDELQGVVAHEMAHIKNKDILFQTVVGIMVGTIVILSDVLLRSVFWGGMGRRSNNDDNKGAAIFMLIGLVFAILAPIFAQLVRFAISRQREYLADATGAQFTRNPEGLASALNKIAGAHTPLRSHNRGTEHMFISPPKADFSAAFSTHPPIKDRIARLMEIGRSFQGGRP